MVKKRSARPPNFYLRVDLRDGERKRGECSAGKGERAGETAGKR